MDKQCSSSRKIGCIVYNLWIVFRISMERGGKVAADEKDGVDADDDDDADSKTSLLETVLKQMYMAYVRNVKFTSPTAWPMIHFMRRSLAEMFNLNHQVILNF